MGYYDEEKNAESYIEMAKGYDGRELIAVLDKVLFKGARVLELGMGPGTDLDILSKRYRATGSDVSAYFVERYRKLHPQADLLVLDAITIKTDRTFDAIYSNKVLYHLGDANLRRSFARQAEVLVDGGYALHSFWLGNSFETMHGLEFHYRSLANVTSMIGDGLTLAASGFYAEDKKYYSFWVLLQKA